MKSIGVHVSKKSSICGDGFDSKKRKSAKSLSVAIQRDVDALTFGSRGINVVQIFTHGPRNTRKNKIKEKDIYNIVYKNDLTLIVHSTHITSHALWETREDEFILEHLSDQLNTCKKIASYSDSKTFEVPLVVHLPDLPMKGILKRLPKIAKVIKSIGSPVLFENVPVSHSKNAFATSAEINTLCDAFAKILDTKLWGICIDTAHLWSCGLNITEYKTQQDWFKKLSKSATSQIKAFHLNGSKNKTFNKSRDMHYVAYSADDDIYPVSRPFSELGIKAILDFAKLRKIPIVCEINRGFEKDVKFSMETLLND